MAYVNRSLTDGRYVGCKSVGGASWVDVALDTLDSSTAEAIPDGARLVDLFVYNNGEEAAFVLLRPHGELADEATTGALIIPPGTGRGFGLNIPDAPIDTIAVLGAVRVEAVML